MRAKFFIQTAFDHTTPNTGTVIIKDVLLKQSFLVVMDNKDYIGILTPDDFVETPRNLVVDCLHEKPRINPNQTIESVLEEMRLSRNKILPVFDDNTFIGVISQSDITDYLVEYKKELENEIKKRTSDLTAINNQLIQAQKMEAIGTLAAGISHDFNNILSPIMGWAEMLLADTTDSAAANKIREILAGANRARDLVRQILMFSRQDNKEYKLLRIQSIVMEMLNFLRASIPVNIEITHHLDNNCRPVMADIVHINQILMNLCTNAYHVMQNTGGKLDISLTEAVLTPMDLTLHPDVQPGCYARLAVTDTGPGIPPDVIDRIFDPFFTTKEAGKGTGLGLSVTHGIVKSYGGFIRVKSKPEKGASFQIYLPLYESAVTDIKTESRNPPVGGNERILLIDDEEQIVYVVQEMLERIGYRVTSHTSCIEAMKAFRFQPNNYDLVITDMTMPEMTGLQFFKKIKEIKDTVPVILCTGFSEQIDDKKAQAIGIKALVMKPILISDLAIIIRRTLDNKACLC